MTSTRFPTLLTKHGDSRIPIYPQPGIFETTFATGVGGTIDSVVIEEILAQPAWNAQDAVRAADLALNLRKANGEVGWQQIGKAVRLHYIRDNKPVCGFPGKAKRFPAPSNPDQACTACIETLSENDTRSD